MPKNLTDRITVRKKSFKKIDKSNVLQNDRELPKKIDKSIVLQNDRELPKKLRGTRDKLNFAKVTCRWSNMARIRRRSRVSNSARNFDLEMWST